MEHPIVATNATLTYGDRTLWRNLNFDLPAGSFLAVLGPNGSGKTSLLRSLLGLQALSSGTLSILGASPRKGNPHIGYIPQQRGFDRDLPIRGRDLVSLGLNGHRFGWHRFSLHDRIALDTVIAAVGAERYADSPIGLLSGGEQQRLRVAQAILGSPELLLCDEPLLSLDIAHQHEIVRLINAQRKEQNATIVFVTHEINPILPYVDLVLYFANGQWKLGTPDDIFQDEVLTELFHTDVHVIRDGGRIAIVSQQSDINDEAGGHHQHGTPSEREADK